MVKIASNQNSETTSSQPIFVLQLRSGLRILILVHLHVGRRDRRGRQRNGEIALCFLDLREQRDRQLVPSSAFHDLALPRAPTRVVMAKDR